MTRLFGTDGIRATAGQYPLDRETVFILGRALAELLQDEGLPPRILIGRDTRESGPWLEGVLSRGIQAGGGEAVSAGVIPTSAISFLTRKHGFSSGIVISASHNPYQDNGIKVFSPKGLKISEAWEERLEEALGLASPSLEIGDVWVPSDASLVEDYRDFLASTFQGFPRGKRLSLVVDCANGASASIAPRLFSDLGFKVRAIHHQPDGKNINLGCGSLYPQELARAVVEERADLGIAYDGDSDRAIWVDEKGRILNGDHTLFVQARAMKAKNELRSDAVVATTMSNMGLEKALQAMGLQLVRTRVGDRYVLEKMMEIGANLGGEQSGHTIFLDDCPTGDGLLTSLKMLGVMLEAGASLSELASGLPRFPQVLLNVPVKEKRDFALFPEILATMEEINHTLADAGRLDVRYSGTEPVARVMVEGEDEALVHGLAQRMAGVIAKHLK